MSGEIPDFRASTSALSPCIVRGGIAGDHFQNGPGDPVPEVGVVDLGLHYIEEEIHELPAVRRGLRPDLLFGLTIQGEAPTVWGFSPRRRAISRLLEISPARNSRRASSRTLLGAFGIASSFEIVSGQIAQSLRLAIPTRGAIRGHLHRPFDERLLFRGDH